MSLPGLPPLPKSLSTLESTGGAHPHNTSNFGSIESQRGVSPVNRKTSTLDTQLAILRREMVRIFQSLFIISKSNSKCKIRSAASAVVCSYNNILFYILVSLCVKYSRQAFL